MATQDTAGKPWNLCNVFNDDVTPHHEHANELTCLRVLEMADATGQQEQPRACPVPANRRRRPD